MGSYVAFYLAGLYPVPSTRQYLLSSPYFPSISFFNPVFNTTTTIIATNFVSNPANGTGGTVFVQNVTIDGQPAPSNCFLEWDVFEKGGTVELTLTDDINVTCGGTLPPSLSTGGFGLLPSNSSSASTTQVSSSSTAVGSSTVVSISSSVSATQASSSLSDSTAPVSTSSGVSSTETASPSSVGSTQASTASSSDASVFTSLAVTQT